MKENLKVFVCLFVFFSAIPVYGFLWLFNQSMESGVAIDWWCRREAEVILQQIFQRNYLPKRAHRQPHSFSVVCFAPSRCFWESIRHYSAKLCIQRPLIIAILLLWETPICQDLPACMQEKLPSSLYIPHLYIPFYIDPSTDSRLEVTPTIPSAGFCSKRVKDDMDFSSPLRSLEGSKPSTASQLLAMMHLT